MTASRPKVAHLIPRDAIGGVEAAARTILERAPLACEVKLQFIEHSGGPSENNPLAHYRALRSLLEFQPDVLVCSLWRSAPIAVACKLFKQKIRLAVFLHSSVTVHVLDRIFSKVMLKACDVVWADSNATIAARGTGRGAVPHRVISFVMDQSPKLNAAKSVAPRFVYWGRLHAQKGLDRAVEFIRLLKKHGLAPVFEVYGPNGGAEDALRRQISALGLEKEVLLKGPVAREELDRVASANSFYLQLSREEGMAMAVVEAMQRSLVPVVTPVGEIANYCVDGENAVLVHEPENPDKAIDRVQRLLENENEYRLLQKAAHARWSSKVLYRDDFCRAAIELMATR